MDEHTPTTESVRYAYVKFTRDAFVASTSELEQEFDRWLQMLQAARWEEGFDAGEADVFQHDEHGWTGGHDDMCIQNPYQDGTKHVG